MERNEQIAFLNDAFRSVFGTDGSGHVNITQGVNALDPKVKAEVFRLVRKFNKFSADNDPYGEHDFGSIDHVGKKVFWKIDYYDKTLTKGSEDPADPAQTTRVMTIMLANEY